MFTVAIKIIMAVFLLLSGELMANSDITSIPFENSAVSSGGSARLVTPADQLTYQENALLAGGKGKVPEFTFPDWNGSEGTVAYRIKNLNWSGNGQDYVVFVRAVDPVAGNFMLYKYGPVQGFFVLASQDLPGQKPLMSFPVYDKELLKDWQEGRWHQIVFTWSQGKFVKLYIDGKLAVGGTGNYNAPKSFSRIALGPSSSGMGYKSENLIKDVFLSPRAITDTEAALLYHKPQADAAGSVIPFAPVQAPPVPDGRIGENEYSTEIPGLVDNRNFRLAPFPSRFYTGCDEENLYLAAEIEIPAGYRVQSPAAEDNDPKLISAQDMFALFLAYQPDHVAEKRQGLYFTMAPDGTSYAALETVDWKGLSCQRDTSIDFNIGKTSRMNGRNWVVEIAIPRRKIPFAGQSQTWLSAGFNLGAHRLSLTPQLVWYDHHQGGSEIVFSKVGVKQQYGPLATGKLAGKITLSAAEPARAAAELKITRPEVQRKSDGMVVEQAINEQLSITGAETFWSAEHEFELAAKEKAVFETGHQLKKPEVYALDTLVSVDGKDIFRRNLIFDYFPPLSLTLQAIPSHKQLAASYQCRLDRKVLDGAQLILSFKQDGKEILSYSITENLHDGEKIFAMDGLPAGKYDVRAELRSPAGQALTTAFIEFEKMPPEPWRVNPVALEALEAGWLPSPWTALKHDDQLITLWGRTYDYSEGVMRQMVSQGDELLRDPITIKYRLRNSPSVNTIPQSLLKFKQPGQGRILVEQRFGDRNFDLDIVHLVEFDGFNRITAKLSPKRPLDLEKLWVEIPFKGMKYRQVKAAEFEKAGLIRSEEFTSFPVIWLGNDRVNCSIMAENCKGWFIHSRHSRISLEHAGDHSTVRLLIVNQPGILDRQLEFSWMMQAGPVKALFEGWRDIRMMGGAWTPPPTNTVFLDPRIWSSSYSYPQPLNRQRLESMIDYMHKQGQKLYPYLTPTTISTYDIIKRDAPVYTFPPYHIPQSEYVHKRADSKPKEEYFYNARDWNMVPHKVNSDGSGKETSELVCVDPDSSWSDYFVHSIRELLSGTDLDGFYFDLPLPPVNHNPVKGLSYRTRDGAEEGSIQWLATRNLYKRLYHVFEELRTPARKPYILGHGTRYAYPVNAFIDIEFHGEAFKPKRAFEFTEWALQNEYTASPLLPPARPNTPRSYDAFAYRVCFGTSYGTPTMLLPQYGYIHELGKRPEISREMISWTFLHDTLLWPAYIFPPPVYDFWNKVLIPFGMGDTEFKGYWENGITADPECVRVSWYRKTGKEDYLLAAVNFSDREVRAEITLPGHLRRLGAIDQESGEQYDTGQTLAVRIPAHDLRVIRLNQRERNP